MSQQDNIRKCPECGSVLWGNITYDYRFYCNKCDAEYIIDKYTGKLVRFLTFNIKK